jgi:hypothetical protein
MLDEYLSKKEKESIRRIDEVQEGWHVWDSVVQSWIKYLLK